MSTTPNLGLEQVPANTLQPSVPINDALQVLDAVVQLRVVDKDLSAPPATTAPDAGRVWIVGTAPTGAWAGRAGQLALCTAAGLWRFLAPQEGWTAWLVDEGREYRFTGGAWSAVAVAAVSLPDYIAGCALEYRSGTQFAVASGTVWIPGYGLAAVPTTVVNPSGLAAATWYHVYAYIQAGSVAIECVTTAPAAPYSGTARAKTGDGTRRYLGSLRTQTAAAALLNWLQSSEEVQWRNTQDGNPFRVLANGNATSVTTVDCSAAVPLTARMAMLRIINQSTTAALYTSTSDSTVAGPPVGGRSGLSAGSQAFVPHPLNAQQQVQYWYSAAPGSPAAYIDVYGYTLER